MARGQKAKATLEDTNADGGATTGYETELWAMADALRGSMTPPRTVTSTSPALPILTMSDVAEKI